VAARRSKIIIGLYKCELSLGELNRAKREPYRISLVLVTPTTLSIIHWPLSEARTFDDINGNSLVRLVSFDIESPSACNATVSADIWICWSYSNRPNDFLQSIINETPIVSDSVRLQCCHVLVYFSSCRSIQKENLYILRRKTFTESTSSSDFKTFSKVFHIMYLSQYLCPQY